MKTPKRVQYEKPVLVKHEALKEVTMASRGKGACSTCSIWPVPRDED